MTKPLQLVALVGAPGAGRKTAAAFLQAHGFAHVAFGDAVRSEVAAAWRIDARMLTDADTREWPIPALAAGMCSETGFMRVAAASGESLTEPRSPAWVLDQWYSWRCRSVPNYFTAIVERAVGRAYGCGRRQIVVSDLNKPGELAMLQGLGASVIRVHRPVLACAGQAGAVTLQRHVIEAHADVLNIGSVQALGEAVAEAVEGLTCTA